MKKSLKYSVRNKAKKFFKKHPKLEEEFKSSIISIAKGEKALNDYDIKPFRGVKNTFRYRKGSQRVIFILTQDYQVIIVDVTDANNRGDIY